MQLQLAQKERDISAFRECQYAEAKALEALVMHWPWIPTERQSKIEKFKQKYAAIASLVGNEVQIAIDDNSSALDKVEERSQAYYIIAAAQQREELQQQGNALNEAIRKAEKEVALLTKTMDHLMNRNSAYRESFVQPGEGSPMGVIKEQLEGQLRAVADSLFSKRSQLREMEGESKQTQEDIERVREEMNVIANEVCGLEKELSEVMRQSQQQLEAFKRAQRVCMRLRQKYQESSQSQGRLLEERPSLQEKKHVVSATLTLLTNFVEENQTKDPALVHAVRMALSQLGLNKFSRPSTASTEASLNSKMSILSQTPSTPNRPPLASVPLHVKNLNLDEVKKQESKHVSPGKSILKARSTPTTPATPDKRTSRSSVQLQVTNSRAIRN